MADAEVALGAVDLGASSGRVVVGRGNADGFTLHEVHRFPNRSRQQNGVLRWDAAALRAGVLSGLRAAAAQHQRLDAVSVDGWAVDYGLLDGDGELIADPAHYRDPRTEHTYAEVVGSRAGLDAATLYDATGIAPHAFNTLFQLVAEQEAGGLDAAQLALLVPDLMTYWLSGATGTELTNASTTQLLDPRTMRWAAPVVDQLAIPVGLFPSMWAPGDVAGTLTPQVAAALGVSTDTQVIVGPSHDTAAAVAGVPAEDDAFAFVCSGTWALVGVELPHPVISDAARLAGFSNEIGVDASIRFLRNVTGFWLLQECVREWQADGAVVNLDDLTAAAELLPASAALIDVQEPAFTLPGGMTRRIVDACRRTSGVELTSDVAVLRCILDSMAAAIRQAVRDAVSVAQRPIRTVHIVGGGVANPLFCQLVADACGLPVVAGPTEAASWGNVLVQARALGVLSGSVAELRAVIREGVSLASYSPRGDESRWQDADDTILAARSAAAS